MRHLMQEVDQVIGSVKLQTDHPELFHYTGPDVLKHIVRYNTIWATHFRDLSDSKEITVLKEPLFAGNFAILDLCLDRDANLVVVELKRTDDGGYMELQAIRYAAMISGMTFPQLVHSHEGFLKSLGRSPDQAQKDILEFLDWDQPRIENFAPDVRIILASANFSKELTTSVLWLNEHELDVTCIRLRPYKDEHGLVP
jgi:hypothetical protein